MSFGEISCKFNKDDFMFLPQNIKLVLSKSACNLSNLKEYEALFRIYFPINAYMNMYY